MVKIMEDDTGTGPKQGDNIVSSYFKIVDGRLATGIPCS